MPAGATQGMLLREVRRIQEALVAWIVETAPKLPIARHAEYLTSIPQAQPAPPNGQLRHIEWETTGFAGVANSTLYLVFDPTDSLSVARSPGKFDGIPCEVPVVRRLERHWYAVLFYTDEAWGEHNQLNCSGIDL